MAADGACLISDRFGFGRDFLRLLLLKSVTSVFMGQKTQARLTAQKAFKKAFEWKLPTSLIVVQLLGFHLKDSTLSSFRYLLDFAVQKSQIAGALKIWSQYFACDPGTNATSFDSFKSTKPIFLKKPSGISLFFGQMLSGKVEKISPYQLFELLLSNEIVILIPKEKIVIKSNKSSVSAELIDLSPIQLKLFLSIFLSFKLGLSLEDISAVLNPGAPFHSLKDSPRIHSLLSSLRHRISATDTFNLSLQRVEVGGLSRYRIEGEIACISQNPMHKLTALGQGSKVPAASVSNGEPIIKKTRLKSVIRKKQILELIAEETNKSGRGLSGADLARSFGISRQAVHRDLKMLCKEGKIGCEELGRYACYFIIK